MPEKTSECIFEATFRDLFAPTSLKTLEQTKWDGRNFLFCAAFITRAPDGQRFEKPELFPVLFESENDDAYSDEKSSELCERLRQQLSGVDVVAMLYCYNFDGGVLFRLETDSKSVEWSSVVVRSDRLVHFGELKEKTRAIGHSAVLIDRHAKYGSVIPKVQIVSMFGSYEKAEA